MLLLNRRIPSPLLLVCSCLLLTGCLNLPSTSEKQSSTQRETTTEKKPPIQAKTTAYPDHGIQVERLPLPSGTPSSSSQPVVIVPTPAKTAAQKLKDGRGIPAYKTAMDSYLINLRANNLAAAESNLLQAQRIAPQSSAVYREMARLANLKKQNARAEAFARKGLTLAQNNVERKLLWRQILQSAQQSKNSALIQEAQQQINRY